MANFKSCFFVAVAAFLLADVSLAVTCPGFPGYCSESFAGQTCAVVCSRGRNNVPLCQEDGTWTDIPRCIEHDPGVAEQIPGYCPGIAGYCSEGFLGHRCTFACSSGPPIDSVCIQDGTWSPYPTCQGDIRETQDGCAACPGPNGRQRNRTAESILGVAFHNPRPNTAPTQLNNIQGRPIRPTFSGNKAFGQAQLSFTNQQPIDFNRASSRQQEVFPSQLQPQQQVPAQTSFNKEQLAIIQEGLTRVRGNQFNQPIQFANFPQTQTQVSLSPMAFRRPNPPEAPHASSNFGPFELFNPSQFSDEPIRPAPLQSFPAIPDPSSIDSPRTGSRFGPFETIDL